jgi:hypothetical protein
MKMPIINFDEHFADFTAEWMKTHQQDYANFDQMEEDMPRIYVAFLNARAKWLGGVTPGSYFTQFEDPKVLVDWLTAYCEEGTPVPDLLLEQIGTVGKPCEKRLLELLKAFPVSVSGFRPIDEAIVTAGGVSTKELDPKTLESRAVPGLYFAGEVIDADAYTGGFNLQIAFATGSAAGKAAGAALPTK